MRVEPASREFSRSSFTTEAGRSTTSPAAILLATDSERTWILPMIRGQCQVSQMEEDKAKVATDFSQIRADQASCAPMRSRVMFNFFLFETSALAKGQSET